MNSQSSLVLCPSQTQISHKRHRLSTIIHDANQTQNHTIAIYYSTSEAFTCRCYRTYCSPSMREPSPGLVASNFLFPVIGSCTSSSSPVHSTISHSTLIRPSSAVLLPLLVFILPSRLPSTNVSNHGRPCSPLPSFPVCGMTDSMVCLSFCASSSASLGSKPNSSRSRRSEEANDPKVNEM